MFTYSKMDAIMGIVQDETGDFIVNEKDKVVNLTQDGVKKGRKLLPYRESGRSRRTWRSSITSFWRCVRIT